MIIKIISININIEVKVLKNVAEALKNEVKALNLIKNMTMIKNISIIK